MAYNRYNLATFYSYQQALDFYNKTKPIRGDKDGLRPLGDRHRKYMHIRKTGDVLECVMYGSTHLTYFVDNTVEVTSGYSSPSVHDFMSAILDAQLGTGDGKLWVKTTNHGFLPVKRGEKITLRMENQGLYCDAPVFPVTHKVDMKAANALMKQFKPFLKYAQGIIKLKGDDGFPYEPSSTTYSYGKGQPEQDLWGELKEAVEPAQMYGLLQKFVEWRGTRQWYTGHNDIVLLAPAKLRAAVREIIYRKHPELFTAHEIKTGMIVRDTNRHYAAKGE